MAYSTLYSIISQLNKVAMGEKPCDLILKNCSVVNVYTHEILKNMQISVLRDRIAYVGNDASHTIGPDTLIIDLGGMYISPGFADSHIHIDQFILPSEIVKKSLLHGVTSFFSDPIDIVSVCGYRGFKNFIRITNNLPIRIFNVVPGGLPTDKKFSYCKSLNRSQESSALDLPYVLGLGEVFSWTKITTRDDRTIKTLSKMLKMKLVINGHTAGATDKKLNACISSGVLSCHEPINFDEFIERLRLGMWVMIREGSIRRDLKEIIPQIISNDIYKEKVMFCSDGLNPTDIIRLGHIDYCVRKSIQLGLDPIDAIKIASKNCFDYYGLEKDFGGIAPGKIADMIVFDNIKTIKPTKVFVGGSLIVSNGDIISKLFKHKIPDWIKQTIKNKQFSRKDFQIQTKLSTVIATTINMKTEIITKKSFSDLQNKDGNVVPSFDKDIWKIAAFDRIFNYKRHTVSFLKNFGAEIDAFASTWNFHENNMIIIGSNENDMAIAANQLIKMKGGMVVIKNASVIASLPFQLAGIMSTDPFEKVLEGFDHINSVISDAGCKFKKPHLVILFLPFLALPEIRLLCSGIIDVKNRSYEPILQ